jgi:hypothetical protein
MKALSYINLVTHIVSWDGVMVERDTKVNCLTWLIS